MSTWAAILYAVAAALPVIMHLGLILGAPWGHLTMGGRWQGALPVSVRALPALAALLLISLATIVLGHAGILDAPWPDWAIWPAVALTLLTTAANLATPSRTERRLWGPVTAVMSAAILIVVIS